jgi:hypothetical protein
MPPHPQLWNSARAAYLRDACKLTDYALRKRGIERTTLEETATEMNRGFYPHSWKNGPYTCTNICEQLFARPSDYQRSGYPLNFHLSPFTRLMGINQESIVRTMGVFLAVISTGLPLRGLSMGSLSGIYLL